MDNRSRKFLWLLIIIDYQYQSIIDGNRSINIIDCYQYAISIDYLFSQTFQLSISSSTNKFTHFDIIAFYLEIPHGRSRWAWASAQTFKERRRKRNNNKLNRVWTTTASQVSWIFANKLEAKSIKFVLLTTRYVNCLNYLCCFSRSHIDEQFSNFATEV